jgi:hypothetical protein
MKRKDFLSVQICGYSARNEAAPGSPAFGSPVRLSLRSLPATAGEACAVAVRAGRSSGAGQT